MKRPVQTHTYLRSRRPSVASFTLLTLLLLATLAALQYLPLLTHPIRRSRSHCLLLLVYGHSDQRSPLIPPKIPGACCVIISRRRQPPDSHCEVVVTKRYERHSSILARLPVADWIFLTGFRTFPCVSTLQNRLADFDARGRVILSQLFGGRSLDKSHILLSKGTLPKLVKMKDFTFQNCLAFAKDSGALPVHLHITSDALCEVPEATHALSDVRDVHACVEKNPTCAPIVKDVPALSHITVLIIRDPADGRQSHIRRTISSVRAILPRNDVLVSQPEGMQPFRPADGNTYVVRTPRDASVRNSLVAAAKTTYVLFIRDTYVITASTRLSQMLAPLHRNLYDIVGGHTTPDTNGTLGDTAIGSGIMVAIRYSFRSEMALRQEVVPVAQLAHGCSRVHRTSDFYLARRETLVQHGFRSEFGAAAHDEFWIRAMRSGLRVATCDTTVRRSGEMEFVRGVGDRLQEGKSVCEAWDRELGDIGGLVGLRVEYDCEKGRVCGVEGDGKWNCLAW